MLCVRRPSEVAIRSYLTAQRGLPFSYAEVGATSATPPRGYAIDQSRVLLGEGSALYGRAVEPLSRWAMFRIGWVERLWPDTPIEAGTVVGILAGVGAFWLNAARIVYVVDEPGPPRRLGFAYGTLPDHLEKGLVKALYPLARRMQKRFARDSMRRMAEAVGL